MRIFPSPISAQIRTGPQGKRLKYPGKGNTVSSGSSDSRTELCANGGEKGEREF